MNSEAKRLFLAMFLTFGFLFVWSKYMAPAPAPVAQTTTNASETPAPIATTTTTSSAAQTASTSTTPATTQSVAAIETFEASNPDFVAKFSNKSGVVTSVELLHYFKEQKKDSKPITVVPLAQPATAPLMWNLAFKTSAAAAPTAVLNDAETNYSWAEKTSTQVAFATNVAPNLKVKKFYRFGKDPYVIEHVLHIENQSDQAYYVDADTSIYSAHIPKSEQSSSFLSPQHPDVMGVTYAQDEELHIKLSNLNDKDAKIGTAPISWAGFSSQYFLLTAIPTEAMWDKMSGSYQNEIGSWTMSYAQRTIAAKSNLEYVLKLYAGPKQMELLASVNPTLDRSVDLGSWIGGLARMIHKLLGWIYGFIPNYGWAIIILTVIVRLAVFPLAQMQARSMKRMTAHKPAMDALKEKYGKDRETYSRELMSYMRTNKINPASGCLPLLIQFPVFIALYRVLYNSIELRHAPFGFWIHDLSAHDPFFVLPVLVGITFYLQTKLNPTPMADPAQQTMMKIMPVMFSVFMIFLPSGLNLYIFVSTLWGIVQQYMVQKQST
ncbi:MAG: membrane protein insertase YidC [Proteobacteria bacterium]|nr:membrane protein insertase YidC [Pseudomonadota bacterium]